MSMRPLECSLCTKKIAVEYTESLPSSKTRVEMCADCPLLAQKFPHLYDTEKEGETHLEENLVVCEKCHTSLPMIKRGEPLGCKECYEVFKEALIEELKKKQKIPTFLLNLLTKNPLSPLYTANGPKSGNVPFASSQITTLSDALNEALKKENYEQAAWIRDQIKSLMEKKDGK